MSTYISSLIQEKQQTFNLIIEVDNSVNITSSKIKEFIPYILKDRESSKANITILAYDKDSDEIKIQIDKKQFTIKKGDKSDINVISFKVLKLSPLKTEKEKPDFLSRLMTLMSRHTALRAIPLFGWLAAVVWALFFPQKSTDLDPYAIEATPETFLDHLDFFKDQLIAQSGEHLTEEQKQKLAEYINDLEIAKKYGSDILQALKSGDISNVAKRLSEEIVDQKESRVSIPLGFYQEGRYSPVLLTFYKKGEEHFCQLVHIDSSLGDKIKPIQEFKLKKFDPNTIERILYSLIPFQKKTSYTPKEVTRSALDDIQDLKAIQHKPGYALKEKKGKLEAFKEVYDALKSGKMDQDIKESQDIVKKAFDENNTLLEESGQSKVIFNDISKLSYLEQIIPIMEKEIAQMEESQRKKGGFSPDLRNPASLISQIILDQGAEAIPSSLSITSSKNWAHILLIEMSQRDAELTREMELGIEFNLVLNLISKELNKIEASSSDSILSRKKNLLNLKRKIDHLEKQFKKDHLELDVLKEGSFKDIKEKIRQLESALNEQRYSDLNRVKIPAKPLDISFPGLVKNIDSQDNQAEITRILDQLQNGLTDPFDLDNLNSMLNLIRDLEQKGAYSEVISYVHSLLSLLPAPNDEKWINLDLDKSNSISEGLGNAIRASWEAHLRLNQSHIWPNHLLSILNAQAIQYTLLNCRYKKIKEKFNNLSLIYKLRAGRLSNQEIKEFGIKAKEQGLTKEELASLIADEATLYLPQLDYILRSHPYYRFTRFPEMTSKIEALIKFYGDVQPSNPLLLDSFRNVRDDTLKDAKFLQNLALALEGFDGTQVDVKEIWASSWNKESINPKCPLPTLLSQIRQSNVFIQSLLHPESALKRGFGGTIEMALWAKKIVQEGAIANEDEEAKYKRAGIVEAKERREMVNRMKPPLKIQIGKAAENNDEPAVIISDSRKNELLEYQPQGPQFFDFRDPTHDQGILGSKGLIPADWIKESIYTEDRPSSAKSEMRERDAREKGYIEPITELTQIVVESKAPTTNLTLEQNARLRGLVVITDHKGAPHFSIFDNVVQFIFDYPQLLEREDVQRVLELALFRSGIIKNQLHYNTGLLVNMQLADRLNRQMESALKNRQYKSLAFLAGISFSINEYAKADPNSKPLSDTLSPLCDVNKYIELANRPEIEPASKKTLYTTVLLLLVNKHKELSQRGENLAKADDIEKKKYKDDYAHFLANALIAYGAILNTGDESGNPALQRELCDWVRSTLLSKVHTQENRNDILNLFAVQGNKRMLADLKWEKVNTFIFENKDKGLRIDLRRGLITKKEGGSVQESTLPSQIKQHPDFVQLFGAVNPVARTQTKEMGMATLYEYDLEIEGDSIHIVWNPVLENLVITKKIKVKGVEGVFQFRPISSEKAILQNIFEKYGVWQNVNNPNQGIVEIAKDDYIFLKLATDSQNKTTIIKAVNESNKEMLDPNLAKEFLHPFGFAQTKDVIAFKDSTGLSEIRFVNMGVTIVKGKDGVWKGTKAHKKFRLATGLSDVTALNDRFGKSFHQFLLPFTYYDEALGIKKTECYIMPIKYAAFDHRHNSFEDLKIDEAGTEELKLPPLRIRFEAGKTSIDEGQMQTSTGGFCYLAYYAFANKEYEKALYYLEKAKSSHLGPQDKEVILKMHELIKGHKDPSVRGIAFRLKAEIAFSQIERLQLGIKAYRPSDWYNFQEKLQDDVKLYKSYLDHLSRKSKEKVNLLGNLLLTQEDVDAFRQIQLESFEFLSLHPETIPQITETSPEPYNHKKITDLDLAGFSREIIKYLKAPTEDMKIENISSYPTLDDFLGSFTGYLEQIRNEKILSNDKRIERLKHLSFTHLPKDAAIKAELARQLLISCANEKGHELIGNMDLEQVYPSIEKLHKPLLSESKISFFTMVKTEIRKEISNYIGPRFLSYGATANTIFDNLYLLIVAHNKLEPVIPLVQPKSIAPSSIVYETNLEKIKTVLNDPKLSKVLSNEEIHAWEKVVENLEDNTSKDKAFKIIEMIGFILQSTYDASLSRHAVVTGDRIRRMEDKRVKVEAYQDVPVFTEENENVLRDAAILPKVLNSDFYEKENRANIETEIEKVRSLKAELLKAYPDDVKNTMERDENAKMRKGITEAISERIKAIENSPGLLKTSKIPELRNLILEAISGSRLKAQEMRESILNEVLSHPEKYKAFKNMLLNPDLYGKEEIFEKALDLFQTNRLGNPELEGKIIRFLLEATAAQQLIKAYEMLDQFKDADPDALKLYSQDLYKFVSDGTNKGRYFKEGELVLDKPSFSRKHLVAEYRSEKIARSFQPVIVEKLVNGKNTLLLLDPGAGKSKWILPEVAYLTAEKGKFPIILVTEEMLGINSRDMDESTREMFRQASHLFDLNRKSPRDIAFLKDEYARLYEAKLTGGYLITTMSNLAALDNEIVLSGEELKKKVEKVKPLLRKYGEDISKKMDPTKSSKEAMDEFFEKIKKDPEVMLAVRGLYEIQQVRQWQKSIRSLLISNDTQFIADEVDDIFSVTKEYNYALGDPEITHEDIRACVHDSMQKIFTSDKMATFRSLLLGNKQPLLKELDGDGNQKIVSELKKLASEMFKEIAPFGLSEENWRLIKEGFNGDEGAFIRYVMGEPGNGIPNLSKVPTDLHKHISILQTLFSSKLKAVFVKDAGYDCDVDIIDGCTVVPRKEGKPLPGMRFSDEYELVAMQYLFHLVKGPSREYFKGIWLELQYLAPMPKVVEDWYNKANVKGLKANEEFEKLYEHLQNNEASWEMKLFILQNDILKNRVKISREQSKCGSQDPLTGANVAGASGTINPYAMPEGFTEDESVNSRKVMGTILTKLAEMLPKQLDTPVGIFGDAKAWLIEKAKDSQCQFIINQEGVGGGTYIFDFIKTLRDGGVTRTLFFKHPTLGQMYWPMEAKDPIPYTGQKISADDLVIYSSSDVRGVDFVMPPGDGELVLGSTTLDDTFIQAIMRARRLGTGQKIKISVPKDFAKAIKPVGALTYQDLLTLIEKRTLDEKEGVNFKAESVKIEGIVPKAIKDVTFKPSHVDPDEYFEKAFENSDSFTRILVDTLFDSLMHDTTRGVFIKRKIPDFKSNLNPVEQKDTLDILNKKFEEQDKQAEKLLNDISINLSPAFRARELNQLIGLDLDDNYINSFSHHLDTRYDHLETVINDLRNVEIKKKKVRFNDEKEKHLKNLNPLTSSSSVNPSIGQEMVQEQQQQQLLQQQMVSAQNTVDSNVKKGIAKHNWDYWYSRITKEMPGNYSSKVKGLICLADPSTREKAIQIGSIQPLDSDMGFSQLIMMTPNYKAIDDVLKMRNGDLLGRVAVVQKDNQDPIFVIGDKIDYEKTISVIGEVDKADSGCVGEVLHLNVQTGEPIVINSSSKTPVRSDRYYNLLAQVKVFAGCIQFKEPKEIKGLEDWMAGLNNEQKKNLIAYIARIHGVSSVTLIPNWKDSPLGRHLDPAKVYI